MKNNCFHTISDDEVNTESELNSSIYSNIYTLKEERRKSFTKEEILLKEEIIQSSTPAHVSLATSVSDEMSELKKVLPKQVETYSDENMISMYVNYGADPVVGIDMDQGTLYQWSSFQASAQVARESDWNDKILGMPITLPSKSPVFLKAPMFPTIKREFPEDYEHEEVFG